MCSNRNGGRSFLKLKRIKNELRSSMPQQRLNHLSLMSIESELLRKQNFYELIHEFAWKKHATYYYSLSVLHGGKNWERFRNPELMTAKTFSFLHCISTLFIWCCRVCYFAWRTLLWGHHATLFFIKKVGALEKLCLRVPKSPIWHWVLK